MGSKDDVHVKNKILIASSGSVASLKVPIIVNDLLAAGLEVRVVVTDKAKHFLEAESTMPDSVQIFSDTDEWSMWNKRGDPVMHIDLMKWADILLIAPLSANTLAKLACGLCDNLVTCTARAWPLQDKPALFCPAMNTHMWEHPVTEEQVSILKRWGYHEIPCIAKVLVCGDKGLGAMAEVRTIVEKVLSLRDKLKQT